MALDPQFDPKQATDAYINSLGDSALAQAAAYTTGNHWLMLGGLIVSVIAAWLLIRSGVLVRVSNSLAQRSFYPLLLYLRGLYCAEQHCRTSLVALRQLVAGNPIWPHQPAFE